MHNLVMPAPPPNIDSFAPEFCFCGKKTVESHEFWFCSTECARLDSLRSLDARECHYRKAMYDAYDQAGAPGHYPRRMMSVDHLRPGPPSHCGIANAPPRFPPPTNPSYQTLAHGDARDRNVAGPPTLYHMTGKAPANKAKAGEPPVAARQDWPKGEEFSSPRSRVHRAQRPLDHTFEQVELDAIPLPEHDPMRSLRRVPRTSDGLKNNIRKSVAALLQAGRMRRGKDDENPESIFGYPVNAVIIPPAREESLPSHRQKNSPSTIPVNKSKALRRSASFAGWDPRGDPPSDWNPMIRILTGMREDLELSGSFDPRSLFGPEPDPY